MASETTANTSTSGPAAGAAAPAQRYRIRAGGLGDISAAVGIYAAAFDKDQVLDILFPARRQHPECVTTYLHRNFRNRYWTPNYRLTVLVGEADGQVAGFTWWKLPNSALSVWDRWLSPCKSTCHSSPPKKRKEKNFPILQTCIFIPFKPIFHLPSPIFILPFFIFFLFLFLFLFLLLLLLHHHLF
jgi:hypothetical protein